MVTATSLKACVRFLIHFGLVEIRMLGQERGSHEQIAHLADVLEFLPRKLADDREPDFDVIREQFEQYARRYPDSMGQRYLNYLDGKYPFPENY